MQVDRETVIQQLIEGGVLERDGCGLFIASGCSAEVTAAVLDIAQRAAEAERDAFLLMCETAAKESRATQDEIARKGLASMKALGMQCVAAGAEKQAERLAERLAEILRARGTTKEKQGSNI